VADQHSRVIAEAASAALSPLGLVRKGRSRIWLDDQSWWLGVAEFKPSNWKPGAYLNVALGGGSVSSTAPLCVKPPGTERFQTCWIDTEDRGLQP